MTIAQQIADSPVVRLASAHRRGVDPGATTKPMLALLASLLVPGLGSVINGRVGKGLGILAGFVVSALFTGVVLGIVGMFAFWLWGLIEAYDDAVDWDDTSAR